MYARFSLESSNKMVCPLQSNNCPPRMLVILPEMEQEFYVK